MDNFREWLSDNLRYFMLGGAILLIVIVLFFGVRAFMGSGKGDSTKDTTENQTSADKDQGNVPSSPANDGETDGKKDANPMETANEDITSLIKSYYKALGDKDITTLRTLVENLAPTDESKITNAKYIEGYEAGNIYTKKGLDDDSYVVYSCFYYICQGIDTKVPALAEFYVVKDTDGNWKIDGAAHDDSDEITKYEVSLRQDDDVKELKSKIQKLYEDAQKSDSALAAFLEGLGDDVAGSTETADGTTLVVTEDCNVRAEANSDAEIIGGLAAGTEVVKKGESGDWILIDYEGTDAYVHSSLLEEKSK
ncbi:SH3 domain-containing protein [Blautia sp. HCP3S3_H10_1]|uniref:SH3 domain-containing protein n=1 Tax=unclassified Blautia TaxID=2648079 RepID=UPI003F90ABAD|nr:SH3 domain-containing protein [Clostridia bacterium]